MKRFRPYLYAIVASALTLGLSACALERVDQSASRAEKDADVANQYARFLRNQRAEERPTVVVSDKPWVSFQPVQTDRRLPSRLDTKVAYRPTSGVTIQEVAQFIASETGLDVRVSPDAADPSVLTVTSSSTDSSSGAGAQNSMADIMPAGLTGLPGSQVTPQGMIYNIKFSGTVSGLLDQATARLGLSWHYDQRNAVVEITYFDTQTFDIWAFGDDQVIESSVKTGLVTSTGTTSTTGSDTSSGASGDSGSNQNTTVTLNTSLMGDIEKAVDSMLSRRPAGRMFLSRSTGSLTVTDRPEVLARISNYLDTLNRAMTQQVIINVKVFEVTLTDSDQMGVNWNAVYQSLSNRWGLSLANSVAGLSTNAVSGSISILDTSSSPWAGSNMIIQALSEQGRVSNVRSPSVTTMNLQPAPMQIGNVQSYIAASTTTTTASVGASTSLTPATITSGFNMTLLPRVIDKDNLLLMISLSMSSRPTFQEFTSGDASVQTADYDTKNASPKVKLRSGQTLVLTGFEETSENASRQGVGDAGFFGLGGSRIRNSTHSVLVVLITPVVLPEHIARALNHVQQLIFKPTAHRGKERDISSIATWPEAA